MKRSNKKLSVRQEAQQNLDIAKAVIARALYIQTHFVRMRKLAHEAIAKAEGELGQLCNEFNASEVKIAHGNTRVAKFEKQLQGMNCKSSGMKGMGRPKESALERRDRLLLELADVNSTLGEQGFDFDE